MNAFTRSILAACFAFSSQVFAAGAIVVNDEEGAKSDDYAIVTQASSVDMASRYALYECKTSGLKSCVVAARFEQCGALAVSDKFFRTGTGATASLAERNALENCPGCKIARSACESSTDTQMASLK